MCVGRNAEGIREVPPCGGVLHPATVGVIHQRIEGNRLPGKGTPVRTIRVADEVWNPAMARAEREGRELHDVIREHLTEYGQHETEKTE